MSYIAEEKIPVICCGPGAPGPAEDKLYCPCCPEGGHVESIDRPIHCGQPMSYVA